MGVRHIKTIPIFIKYRERDEIKSLVVLFDSFFKRKGELLPIHPQKKTAGDEYDKASVPLWVYLQTA